MSRAKQDPTWSRDPREDSPIRAMVAGKLGCPVELVWPAARPKANLERLLRKRGTSFTSFGKAIGAERIGDMASGKRRMSNAVLLRAARELEVSPLFLLDLTDNECPPPREAIAIAEDARRTAEAIRSDLKALEADETTLAKVGWMQREWMPYPAPFFLGAYAEAQLDWPDEVINPEEYESHKPSPTFARIKAAFELGGGRGDYRDPQRLLADMTETYPRTVMAAFSTHPTD